LVELNLSLTEIFSTVNPNTLAIYRIAIQSTLLTAKVLATDIEISGQDTAAELAALKATTQVQDAKIKVLSAQLRCDTSGAKWARNGVCKRNLFQYALFLLKHFVDGQGSCD
jgi:hypothetical protein